MGTTFHYFFHSLDFLPPLPQILHEDIIARRNDLLGSPSTRRRYRPISSALRRHNRYLILPATNVADIQLSAPTRRRHPRASAKYTWATKPSKARCTARSPWKQSKQQSH